MKSDFCRDQLQPSSTGDVVSFLLEIEHHASAQSRTGYARSSNLFLGYTELRLYKKAKQSRECTCETFLLCWEFGYKNMPLCEDKQGEFLVFFSTRGESDRLGQLHEKQNVFALLRDASGMGSAEAMSLQRQQRHEDNGQKESFFFSPSLFTHLPFPTLQTNATNHTKAHVNHSFCIHARAYVRACGP